MVPGNLAHVDKAIMAIHGKITEREESSTVPTSKAQEGSEITSIQQADSGTQTHYCRKTFYSPKPTNQNYLLLSTFFLEILNNINCRTDSVIAASVCKCPVSRGPLSGC